MIKNVYIKPRQTGKTTAAIELMRRAKGGVLYLCWNYATANMIKDKMGKDFDKGRHWIVPFSNLRDYTFEGLRFEFVIMDEFAHLPWSVQKKLYELITTHKHKIQYLYMVTTPHDKIEKVIFDYIRENKGLVSFADMMKHCQDEYWMDEKAFSYWYHNFMTDRDTNIVKDDFRYSQTPDEKLKQYVGEKQFDLEFKNTIFI